MMKLFISIFLTLSTFASVSTDLKIRLKNFRDPFKKNLVRKKSNSKEKKIKKIFNTAFDVSNIAIEDIRIIGIYLGRKRRAIAVQDGTGGNNETFIIREGMRIGPEGIEVKAILPAGIVLVEKITNVYDEIEYLETIIPVSDK